MMSLHIDIKELSLKIIIFMISMVFIMGPSLRLLPEDFILLFRGGYIIIMILMIFFFGKVRNIEIFILFFVLFLLLAKFENPIILNYFVIVLLCIYLRRFKIDVVIINLFRTLFVLVIVHVILYKFGFVIDTFDYISFGRPRVSMGFSNPNQVAVFYFSVLIVSYAKIIILKNAQKIKFIIPLILIFYSLYVIVISDSRTSLYGCIIVAVSELIFRRDAIKIIILKLTIILVPTLTTLIVLLHDTFLNVLLSYRPAIMYNQLIKMGGFNFIFGLDYIMEIDSFVGTILPSVGFPIFFILWFWLNYSMKNIDLRFFSLILSLLVMSIFESILLRPEIPASLLFISLIAIPRIGLNQGDIMNDGGRG